MHIVNIKSFFFLQIKLSNVTCIPRNLKYDKEISKNIIYQMVKLISPCSAKDMTIIGINTIL